MWSSWSAPVERAADETKFGMNGSVSMGNISLTRTVRRRSRSRKSISKAWGIAPAAVLVLGGAYAFSNSPMGGQAIAAALADPLSVFSARSPGGRAPGALTQTKPARSKGAQRPVELAEVFPSERVLSNIRTRQPDEFAPADLPDALFIGPVAGPVGGGAVPGIDTLAPVLPTGVGSVPIFTPGGIGPIVPGGGGGGGTGEPPTTTPVEPTPPVTPSVPEPTTWLMMIAGFFAVGLGLRSRRRAIVAKAAAERPSQKILSPLV